MARYAASVGTTCHQSVNPVVAPADHRRRRCCARTSKGGIVPKAFDEQLTYVLEGVLRFWMGDDQQTVIDMPPARLDSVERPTQGRSARSARRPFYPPRQDGSRQNDSYLRTK